jgi:hypothetical protein
MKNLYKLKNKTGANHRFKKLRAKWFMRLHHFLLNLVRADKFLQVKPQILKPANRYKAF